MKILIRPHDIGKGSADWLGTNAHDWGFDGVQLAIAKAVDLAGNEEFTSIPFKYDTIKPSVTAITGNTTTKGENVVLTISIKDTNPVAPLVEVTGYNGTITACSRRLLVMAMRPERTYCSTHLNSCSAE